METYQAFDKMLKVLNIKAQEVCERSGVSKSHLSQFRSSKGSDIGCDHSRDYEALTPAIPKALNAVSVQDARGGLAYFGLSM
jgi:hypothetical protein